VCGCPFDQPPTAPEGKCYGTAVFSIREGRLDDVDLAGVNVALSYFVPETSGAGNFRQGLVIDQRASDEQADAVERIFSGKEGGPWGDLAGLVSEYLGAERGRVTFSDGDSPSATAGDRTITIEASAGTTAAPRRSATPRSAWPRSSRSDGLRAKAACSGTSSTPSTRRPATSSTPRSSQISESEAASGAPRSLGLHLHPARPRLVQIALVAVLLGLVAVGWLVTDERMEGMDMGPGTDLGALGFYVSAWVVMMAAMMFPSAAPMVLAFARIQQRRRERSGGIPGLGTGLFVGGYLVSWSAFGLAAYGLFALAQALSIEAFSWDRAGPYLAGAVIVGAAGYQLTPLKNVCLSRCRGPLDFVLGHWRSGYGGAFRMGVEHGGFWVGCCWGLMAALFALGVMSVGWMVFVAALIATEKMLPWRRAANRGVAALLLVLGLSVAFAPGQVPGLTTPDEAQAMMPMDNR
jgi:predicted metal-binding membrane protein